MDKIAIVVCLHGNELFGLEILDELSDKFPVIIGNPLAIEKKTRCIDADLNRVFPGNHDGNYEEKRAFDLLNKLKDFETVIDIHSSSSEIELFAIITDPNEEKVELAKSLGIQKIVMMPKEVGKGRSLIENLNCAISIEIGPHEKKENVGKIVRSIRNLGKAVKSSPKIFEVFAVIKNPNNAFPMVKNFQQVRKGDLIAKGEKDFYAQFDFIPIFVGEEAYKETLCMACREKP